MNQIENVCGCGYMVYIPLEPTPDGEWTTPSGDTGFIACPHCGYHLGDEGKALFSRHIARKLVPILAEPPGG